MANEVILKNGISISAGGNDILNGLIGDLFDQDDVSAQYNTDLMDKLGLTATTPLNLEETFDIMVGSGELDEIEEGENLPEIDLTKGKGKGFELKQFGGKYKVSKLFMKWAEKSQTLAGADSSVKSEWARIARNIKGLDRSKVKTKNKLFAELVTKGKYSNAAYGPGSLTPYGQPLFSASHPYLEGTKTFSNVAELALDSTNLLTVINQLKTTVRLQNGDYVEVPNEYELLVPRALETTARTVLNNGSKFSGAGTNANELNIFLFEGSRIKLTVIDTWGSLDKRGNMIGAVDMWVAYNKDGARQAQAARFIELYPAAIEVYKNDDNKNEYISVDLSCTCEHYGLEQFMVGSKIPAVV